MMPPARRATCSLMGTAILAIAMIVLWAVFADERLGKLTVTTMTLAAGTCLISVPVGTLLAVLVARTDMPGRRGIAAAIGLLLFVPLYVQVAAWRAGFDVHGVFAARGSLHGMPAAVWIPFVVGIFPFPCFRPGARAGGGTEAPAGRPERVLKPQSRPNDLDKTINPFQMKFKG